MENTMKKLEKNIDQVSYGLNKIISANLNKVLEDRNISKAKLCDYIQKEKGFTTSRPHLSRCLNNPDKHSVPLPFLLACCDYLKISFEDLISPNFNKNEIHENKENIIYTDLIDTSLLTQIYAENFNESKSTPSSLQNKSPKSSPLFVEDPSSPSIQKYMQNFFCYYYPTVSEENHTNDTLLTGNLKLYAENGECKAKLIIDTDTLDENGNPNLKIYEGNFVLSTAVQCVHCILRSEKAGEYCIIIFRYSHVNYDPLHCRMAEVLTSSSTVDKRYPTVLRMFLSIEKIQEEDLKYLAPHLWLNYSKISITEEDLLSLEDISDDYKTIVHTLLDKKDAELMYRFKESDALNIAEDYLTPEELPTFLSELRRKSFAYHYNKVSPKLDATVWNLLNKRGYYQKKKKTSHKK